MIENALREYGLSENEIRTYIQLIKMGECSAQELSKQTGLPRTTTYNILSGLEEKGVVSSVIKNLKKYFQPTDPNNLLDELENKKKLLKNAIPEFEALSKLATEKPMIQSYKGLKSINVILDDILTTKQVIYHYGAIRALHDVLKHRFPQFILKRIERKIPIRIIGKKEKMHADLIKNAKKEKRSFRFIKEDLSSNVFIYDNKVAILSIDTEPYHGVIIKDKDFAKSQVQIFELMWKQAKSKGV